MICYCKIQIITFDDFSHRLYVLRQLSFHSMMIHRPILHTYIVYSTIQLQCWDNIKNVTKYSLSGAFYRLHDRVPIHIPLIATTPLQAVCSAAICKQSWSGYQVFSSSNWSWCCNNQWMGTDYSQKLPLIDSKIVPINNKPTWILKKNFAWFFA